MPFRQSQYIDFNTDTVIEDPMALMASLPRPWTLDQKIEIHKCMVDVWQLGVAVAILRQIEAHQQPSTWSHSAYGLLSIVFTYFEMLGKSLSASGKAGDDFNIGFCDVYPAFTPTNGIYADKIVQTSGPAPQTSGPAPQNPDIQPVVRFRDRIRNGIYHLGYTQGAVVLHNQKQVDFEEESVPDPSNPSTNITIYKVNPHTLVRTLVTHFPGFTARLGTSGNATTRKNFDTFFDQFLAP